MSAHATTHAGGDAGHEEHSPVKMTTYGFWLYIMTDCILFGTLFATYAVFMDNHFAGGPTGKEIFELPYVLTETMLLLFSSVTYGFAMLSMQKNKSGGVMLWLALTFLLGLGFIGMEINEFHHLVAEGFGPERSGFLSAFFTLVGTHGTHVTFGLIWIATMVAQVGTKGLTMPVKSRLVRLSTFWHFLDIVWIGVFTVVYLMGVL